ncbi:MAG: RNA polymerase subunit sigma [Leptotrichiaceae bacterium]|nr:RNA polymerase subunit sigma [Leptotrichiaceae bacterium]MBP6281304.1 RNA polymerase subunit sigma [Leptotrichiaceae bacterium]MBP7101367.1 RNA polymerase subunit sigma [Leptotrichiaceae bacterium]MBP7739130.1 RNA polymerase subunit sigma [Leptotrichiaceae bacterium]MBP9630039.1 RNA polymerase subunit sigma [Leptotrichiaceae bacterium]
MLKKIIDDTKKTGKFNFEKIIENNKLTDDDFFEFIKFIYKENIPEIRNSVDGKDFIVLEDENYYMEEKETIKAYLEDIKEKHKTSNKENNKKEELIDKYLKVAVRESLIYSKYGFSFLDLVQEATLGVMSVLNYYDKIIELTNEPEFFIKNFAIKYILEFQKELLKDIKSSELSYILYLKMKVDREMGYSMEEISKQMNVTSDYIEQLENLFDGIKSKELMGNDEILEKADKITQRYILENIPKKLSYIDEQILVMYYGLEDRVYTEKEIAKVLNIGHHNINILKEKALNKLSINMLKNEFTRNSEESEYLIN